MTAPTWQQANEGLPGQQTMVLLPDGFADSWRWGSGHGPSVRLWVGRPDNIPVPWMVDVLTIVGERPDQELAKAAALDAAHNLVRRLTMALALVSPVTPPESPASCLWLENEEGAWETACGETWEFAFDGPAENGCRFCFACGAKIDPVSHVITNDQEQLP